jgi:hypothetical protein
MWEAAGRAVKLRLRLKHLTDVTSKKPLPVKATSITAVDNAFGGFSHIADAEGSHSSQ